MSQGRPVIGWLLLQSLCPCIAFRLDGARGLLKNFYEVLDTWDGGDFVGVNSGDLS